MKKTVCLTTITISLLLLVVACGGCGRLSSADQAELEKMYQRVGSRDVSARDTTGNTLLHHAAMYGSSAVVKYFVSKGASLEAQNGVHQTPLHCAVFSNENIEVTKFLLSKEKGSKDVSNHPMTLLHCAASNENVAVIKYIASKGQKSNVNAKDVEGSTPLHWAASNKNVEVAKYLVSLGADVKAKNKDGKTPFDIAKQKERYGFASPEVVKYLSNQ